MGLRQTTQAALSGSFWPTLCLLSASALVQLAGEPARGALRYERGVWESLELYRLLSGHVTHLGLSHFVLNAVGLVLVAVLVGPSLSAAGWWFVVAVSAIAIDSAFWFLRPTLDWYVGLSGVLHGMLAAGVLAAFNKRKIESTIIAIALVAKLVYEQVAGSLPGSELVSGGNVVVDAHLFGAVGGVAAVAIMAGFGRRGSV